MTSLAGKTFLVTGCAGFIASRTAHMLLDQDATVIGVDNLNDYYDIGLKQHRLDQLTPHPRFQFHPIDIEDLAGLTPLFQDHSFDGILNLAARAGVRYSLENPHVYMSTNAQGNLNLLELARQHDVSKYVLASTSSLYAGQSMPFTEDLAVNEPISTYAASKKAAEVTAFTYHYLFGIDVTVVRYFTVFGPAGRPDMSVFRFIRWIDQGQPIELFGDGTQSRDFTYVDDIARGTIAALKPLGYEIINLGGGNQPISINDVISQLEEMLGKKAEVHRKPFHKADLMATWADISKAQQLLGWQPTVSPTEGMQRSVQWYRDHQPWTSEIQLT